MPDGNCCYMQMVINAINSDSSSQSCEYVAALVDDNHHYQSPEQ